MPMVSLTGVDLYYESHGDGPETVVFLHGGGGNHMSWWQQVPVFRDEYRCITIDHRAFGQSIDHSGEGHDRYAADLEELLAHLGIDRVALVAQSMGGRTASEFALAHPDRVWALAMCDTLGMFVWDDLQPKRERLREERLAAAREAATILTGYMAPAFLTDQPVRTFLYRQIQGLNPPRGQAFAAKSATQDQVAALTVPTLFLVGSEDPVAAPELVRDVAAVVPGAEFVEVAGSGHSTYFEKPDEFNAALAAFFKKRRPSTK